MTSRWIEQNLAWLLRLWRESTPHDHERAVEILALSFILLIVLTAVVIAR
jgi:hypothetical protein